MRDKSQKTTPTDKVLEEEIQKAEIESALEQINIEKEIRKKELSEINRRWNKTSKPYTQTSKKIVGFCLLNFLIVELFAMVMVWKTSEMEVISILITSIAVTCLGAIIWYMKNSEAEKKARINMELERMKINKVLSNEEIITEDDEVEGEEY